MAPAIERTLPPSGYRENTSTERKDTRIAWRSVSSRRNTERGISRFGAVYSRTPPYRLSYAKTASVLLLLKSSMKHDIPENTPVWHIAYTPSTENAQLSNWKIHCGISCLCRCLLSAGGYNIINIAAIGIIGKTTSIRHHPCVKTYRFLIRHRLHAFQLHQYTIK